MTTHGYFLDHIWLIPLFPAMGAALMLFFGKKLPNAVVNVICVGSVGVSFVYALSAVWGLIQLAPESRLVQVILFDWIPVGWIHTTGGQLVRWDVPWGLMLDRSTP